MQVGQPQGTRQLEEHGAALGIFRLSASGTAHQELRETLDSSTNIDLSSQSALLLAIILKVSTPGLQLRQLGLCWLACRGRRLTWSSGHRRTSSKVSRASYQSVTSARSG